MSSSVFILNLIWILSLCFSLWLLSLKLKNVSIVDIFWGVGFIVVALLSFLQQTPPSLRAKLVVCLVSIWGLRLAGYLAWRNWGKPEDYRYRAMREKVGAHFKWLSLFSVFGLQGLLILWVSLPLQVAVSSPIDLGIFDAIGSILVIIGISFESIGDFQLAQFKSNPSNRGKVFDKGLWKYTRHPNYFGDFLVWWGFYAIAISSGGSWTLGSPIVMSFLLLKVSGVSLLESALQTRKEGYQEYMKRTSSFFPRPPKP